MGLRLMTTSDRGDIGDLVLEFCQSLGACRLRRMFGGQGLFCGSVMFGLIIDGVLYFKTDDRNRPDFAALGLSPFVYDTKNGRRAVMAYHQAPDGCLDEPDQFQAFATGALDAARRQAAAAPPKPRPSGRAEGPAGRRRR